MNNIVKNVGSALHLSPSKDNQHPSAAGEGGEKSNLISIDVDDSYKVFTEFQVNLKHLATLYKTEHELMKSLNENGIYTAKCYQKMLANSPLEHIVASTIEEGESPKKAPGKKKNVEPESIFEPAAVGVSKSESVDDAGQGESIRKMEPEEVLEEQEYRFDKDVRSSHVANAKNSSDVLKQGAKKIQGLDPPSTESLLKTMKEEEEKEEEDQKVDDVVDEPAPEDSSAKKEDAEEEQMSSDPQSDHPSESEFPNDEQPGDEVDNSNTNFDTAGVNVMMGVIDDDDDDSFTHDVIDDDDSFTHDNTPKVDEAKSDSAKDSDDGEETKDEPVERGPVDPDGEVVEAQEEDSSNVELNESDPDNAPEPASAAAAAEDKKESEIEVICEEGEKDESETLTSFGQMKELTYFDVHKQVYKENNSYLKKHSKLVEYTEDWEKTVTTRVQSMHVEYQKLRKGLNHYIGKVDALENEKKKTEEKHKEIAPKRLEKLERNRTKLMGTRKSHDVAGIDLIILIDEIVNRSWRDAYPLLQKSVAFETDLSSMQANIYGGLSAAATMLDHASRKESISSSHRLLQLKNSSPDELNFHKFKGDW
eukprot:CAMPEP_0113415286 /NCGR_PEP_ID=MMETSP0013_2-20120614/24484_1 /TAXON_ID=2843 ORGANISM="Skeletonema costatum, Strain 1716" /NCGR_SAMPLE_ID=MMETSP0013_2 /ASSEMBLY_ACC=CAM_ASM_000158 /LENGTH=590 /DNA_ID=CAMNT_0000302229 /DNA_START=252 /DNA_END=2021 /DNA_ORIENTATION=- /assembly_acc=CAM_ASM_000158